MNDKIRLIGEPEQPPVPQQPTYPFTSIQFAPSGMITTFHLADDMAFVKTWSRQDVAELRNRLNAMAMEEQAQLAIMQHINNSKLH